MSVSGTNNPPPPPPEEPPAPEPTERVRVSPSVLDGAAPGQDEETPEARAARLEQRVGELEAELALAREHIREMERRAEVERALAEAGAIDLETAALLAERRLAEREGAEPGPVIAELRASKPFLFEPASAGVGVGSTSRSRAMGASSGAPRGSDLEDLADAARSSGDRREVMRYMRGRRGV